MWLLWWKITRATLRCLCDSCNSMIYCPSLNSELNRTDFARRATQAHALCMAMHKTTEQCEMSEIKFNIAHTDKHRTHNLLTWIVTMRGKGCRVLAPPSIATPRVLALFSTRTKRAVATGKGEPVS